MAIIATAHHVQFELLLDGEEQDDFLVLGFSGREELSRPGEFSIQLACQDDAVDLRSLLGRRAALRVERDPEPLHFHGVLVEASRNGSLDDWTLVDVKLVPRFWLTSLSVRNEIYLDLSVPGILETVLLDDGLSTDDFRITANAGDRKRYPVNEYTVQYAESDFNLLSRLMEKVGLFYRFEHGTERDVLVIADDAGSYTALERPGGGPFHLRPDVGLEVKEEVLTDFQSSVRLVPEKVVLKDYNYRHHRVDLQREHPLGLQPAFGARYEYGDHYKTQEEGDWIGQVRAEELACQRERFVGSGIVRAFAPGCTFRLDISESATSPLDGEYLLVRVLHAGNQEEAVLASGGGGRAPTYHNQFECIRADVAYRAPRTTPVPRVTGMITATVDSSGGDYADLDDEGRYAVKMHFDLTDRRQASATKRVRMMQPYGGDGHGMHLPLQQGTEVALFCMDGDPDRPVIAGVLPNPGTASQVTAGNRSQNVIRSVTGNAFVLDDDRGNEKVTIHSVHDYSLQVDNDASETVTKNRSVTVSEGDETHTVTKGTRTTTIQKDDVLNVEDGDLKITVGKLDASITAKKNVKLVAQNENVDVSGKKKVLLHGDESLAASGKDEASVSGKKISITGGSEVTIGVGGSTITITASGIEISAPKITSAAQGNHEITGALVKIN